MIVPFPISLLPDVTDLRIEQASRTIVNVLLELPDAELQAWEPVLGREALQEICDAR